MATILNVKRIGLFQLRDLFCLLIFLLLCSCTYKDRVAPVKLPEKSSNMVVVGNGLKIAAVAFVDSDEAKDVFGFNVRDAGLLPVQVTFQNDSSLDVQLVADQTFLIDQQSDAWPVATQERTYRRTKEYVDVGETFAGAAKPSFLLGAAGAVAGLAVGIVTGENIGEAMGVGATIGAATGGMVGGADGYSKAGAKIKEDLANKSLNNKNILAGQIAYGVLFFPGMPEEAQGARELRLYLQIGGQKRIVKIVL